MKTRLTDPRSIRAAAEFETKLAAKHDGSITLLPGQEWLGAGGTDNELATREEQKLKVKCGVCAHEWSAIPFNLTSHGKGCPSCSAQRNRDSWGKLRSPRASEAEKQRARDMRADGKTYGAIADELGRSSQTTIQRWCDPAQAEKNRLDSATYRAANLEACRANVRRHQKETPHGKAGNRAKQGRRRKQKRGEMEWIDEISGLVNLLSVPTTGSDLTKEQAYYIECERLTKETGVLHHVDHIWPLSKGGPHIFYNLQVTTAEENLKKNDRFSPEDQALYAMRVAMLFAGTI